MQKSLVVTPSILLPVRIGSMCIVQPHYVEPQGPPAKVLFIDPAYMTLSGDNQEVSLSQLFFLTPAAEKTKTQAENSSQKLKEKTQPQGGTFLLLRETQEKKSFFPKKFKNQKKFQFQEKNWYN